MVGITNVLKKWIYSDVRPLYNCCSCAEEEGALQVPFFFFVCFILGMSVKYNAL